MRTIKRDGAIVLKRLGTTYFILINGLNVFEIDGDYDKALSVFNKKIEDRKRIGEMLAGKK